MADNRNHKLDKENNSQESEEGLGTHLNAPPKSKNKKRKRIISKKATLVTKKPAHLKY